MSQMHDSIYEVLKTSGKTLTDLQESLALEGEFYKNSVYELQTYKNDLANMPIILACIVAKNLNLNFESLYYGNFDVELCSMQLLGDTSTIPKKYDSYNGTYIKTIGNFLNFAKSCYGENYADNVRQKFQLTKKMVQGSPGTKINGQLLMDLFEELKKDGIDEKMFFNVGLNGARSFAGTIIPKLSSLNLSPKQLYEEIIYNLDNSVEQNLKYEILEADNQKMIFSATIRNELSLAIGQKTFGSTAHSYNIMGWFSGFLEYLYNTQALIKKLSCAYLGDDHCIYEIDYSHASRSEGDSANVLHILQ